MEIKKLKIKFKTQKKKIKINSKNIAKKEFKYKINKKSKKICSPEERI